MRRLLGIRDFVHDAIEVTTNLVEETHEAAAHKPIAALSLLEPIGTAARAVDGARHVIAKTVFDRIRATNRTVQAISDAGLTLAQEALGPALGSAPDLHDVAAAAPALAWFDRAESAFNAIAGDFLAARGNGLAIEMSLRDEHGRDLMLEPAAFAAALPHAHGKLCLFLHGLGCSDSIWHGHDAGPGGARSFGAALERELGYTPLYLRYNTGLHISQNGRALAQLLDALAAVYPGGLTEIALVGHSMGGLVARSAAHYAQTLELPWLGKLTHVMCIGSPHFGAPLERAGNLLSAVLRAFDVAGTQVPAKVLDARSAGIKDLRFGSVLDEDWLGADPDAFFSDRSKHAPFVDAVSYGYIAGHVRPAGDPLGALLGDLLVQVPSACGQHRDPARHLPFHMGHVIEGAHHIALTTHPEVYAPLKRFLTEFRPIKPREMHSLTTPQDPSQA